MHLEPGFVIWIIVIAIGIFSTVRKSIRKAAQPAQVVPQSNRVPVHEQTFMPSPEMPQPMAIPIPVAPVVIRERKPAQRAAQKQPVDTAEHAFATFQQRRDGTQAFRGMFEGENIKRAFVAAQVFGPPKALQEQSIWSPRHSEPSI